MDVNKMITLKSINVDKYRGLKNLSIEFNRSNPEGMNFNIFVGENGTHKTTIFEFIYDCFTGREINSKFNIKYEFEGKEYNLNSENRYDKNRQPSIFIFSYALVDRLNKVSHTLSPIREFSTYMVDYYLSGDNQLDFLFEKVGIEKENLYIELQKSRAIILRKLKYREHEIDEIVELFNHFIQKYHLSFQRLNFGDWIDFENGFIEYKNKSNNVSNKDFQKQVENIYIELYGIVLEGMDSIDENELYYSKDYRFKRYNLFYKLNHKVREVELLKLLRLAELIGFVNPLREVWMKRDKEELFPLSDLSTGQFSYFYRLMSIYKKVENNSIILIDEPEVHLHPSWIVSYLNDLQKILSTKSCHVLIATHSPIILTNVSIGKLICLEKNENGEIIEKNDNKKNIFGAEADEILLKIFGVKNSQSGIIQEYIKETYELFEKKEYKKAIEKYEKMAINEDKLRMLDKYFEIIVGEVRL